MPRYFIQLAYNGANYNGWQIQKNTPHTIQQVLEEKLVVIIGHPISTVGCGRTDTGVHAKNYYAHFDSDKLDLHILNANYVYKLNKILPFEIAVKNIYLVGDTSNARFDAEYRTYDYFIHLQKNPFLLTNSVYVYGNINFEAMNEAANYLITTTDFTSFSKVNTQTKTNNCRVTYAKWIQLNTEEYVFKITANRFLHNMVRSIVGTLLEVGKHKITFEQFKTIVTSKNRSKAGASVPAHGLYLSQINYPSSLFNG